MAKVNDKAKAKFNFDDKLVYATQSMMQLFKLNYKQMMLRQALEMNNSVLNEISI
jgi:hypothetical protein